MVKNVQKEKISLTPYPTWLKKTQPNHPTPIPIPSTKRKADTTMSFQVQY